MEDNEVKSTFNKKGFVCLGEISKDGITSISGEPFTASPYLSGSITVTNKLSDEAQFAADMAFTSGYAVGQSDMKKLKIEKVEFNGPATIVWWSDGDKTVVKYDNYSENRNKLYILPDKESWMVNGITHAIAKKMLPGYLKQIEKIVNSKLYGSELHLSSPVE